MKQLTRRHVAPRPAPGRRRTRSADPVIAAELALIVEVRRAQAAAATA